jgi:beta-galactosidase
MRLTADRPEIRANRNDLAYVTVEVVDAAGELAAVGSGNPCDPSSFRRPERTAFQGRCLAILRPAGDPGKLTLKAEAEKLSPATVTVRCIGR